MTLHSLIRKLSDLITPSSNDFYSYILYTSDDNGGFLRTRYCWRDRPIKDRELHEEYRKVLVDCNKEIRVNDLINKKGTKLKIQLHYGYLDATFEDAKWDVQLEYNYIYIFDLDTGKIDMKYIKVDYS